MKLNFSELKKGSYDCFNTPKFDLEQVKKNTEENPTWVHFGGGNIFRAFIARIHQELLNEGAAETGIVVAESFDFEVIDRAYAPFDNLSLVVLMNSDGKFDKTVVASVTDAITTRKDNGDYDKLVNMFEKESLQIVSFTITEKGYVLKDSSGSFFSFVQKDIDNGPNNCIHIMSIVTSLLYKRFMKNKAPITILSMDNCSHNGDKLKDSVVAIAIKWVEKGFLKPEFLEYIADEGKVTFPLSMIDKITPRPSEDIKKSLENDSMENMDIIITNKKTYTAPFVNAEVNEYLVIEDKFPNGRPILEKAGVIFADRDTVNNVETMKVTTCLNPLHTALAVTGCLLSYTLIADQMKDETLKKLVNKIGYDEGLKVVVDLKIISPKQFIDEVVNERFANPFIPDTPQRIATDTSQKVGIRFGETIKAYVDSDDLDVNNLVGIPLAIAAWLRYMMAVDDSGKSFILSPDPMLDELLKIINKIKIGDASANITEILANEKIFGCDLYNIGLGDKIEQYFIEMIKGVDAVRATLDKYL